MKKEDNSKASLEDHAFEVLEQDIQDVLSELMGKSSLDVFRNEYEKLHKALKKSHESERRLVEKCRELNAEIVANSAKVSTALKLSQEDNGSIVSLKKEIDKAWKLVDTAHEKEARARATIQSLKLEIANVSKLVEQGAGLAEGQEQSVNELLKIKEDLTKDRDEILHEVVKLREMLAQSNLTQEHLEKQKAEADEKIQELTQEIQVRNNEAHCELRKRDKMEREKKQTKADLDAKAAEIKTLRTQINRYQDDIGKLEQQLKEQRILNERVIKDADILNTRFQKLQTDFENQLITTDTLASENQARVAELKLKEDEVSQLKSETHHLDKVMETIHRKLRQVEGNKADMDFQRDSVKGNIIRLERELEASQKQTEADKKQIDRLVRERDLLHKEMLKAVNATGKQVSLVKLHEQSKKNLEQEMMNYREEAQKQRKIIYQLEKERDRYINQASDLTQKVLQHMEDVKLREMQIFDFKKKMAESETKLKQQQNLYEAVRSDRNLYSRNLIECQDEIRDLKRKLNIMNHQIDQLTYELQTKEALLVKEYLEHQRVEKEKDALKAELQKLRLLAAENKAYIEAQEAEERKLLKIISEADAERQRQQKELDQVISERDILGTQLVRRNDELALLYEQIKIQQSLLIKGEIQYNQRLEDHRVLKLTTKKLHREKGILQKFVANVDDLRVDVNHIQRELLLERTRCKALEEELENPMNIHRWRKLEGSDPDQLENIQRKYSIQKRIISNTDEVIAKGMLSQEKEKLYLELKHILARHPGPEVAEQLPIYQQTLKKKTNQLKCMASELNMYQSQVKEFKYEIEKIAKELQDVEKKYLMQKEKDRSQKEKERALAQAGAPVIQPQRTDGPRFTC